MDPQLYTLIGATASAVLIAILNALFNRKKNNAETGKEQAEATSLITNAATSIIGQLQENAKTAQIQFEQVSEMQALTRMELEETRVELQLARDELKLLRGEINSLREYVRHLGGDPDNPPSTFGHPPTAGI